MGRSANGRLCRPPQRDAGAEVQSPAAAAGTAAAETAAAGTAVHHEVAARAAAAVRNQGMVTITKRSPRISLKRSQGQGQGP